MGRSENHRNNLSVPEEQRRFFLGALRVLDKADVPFLIGGGYALNWYAGLHRDTKDLDVFVLPRDCRKATDALAAGGFETAVKDELWLAKAIHGDYFMDIIWGTGNWLASVDQQWFANARHGEFLQKEVAFVAPEEMIWVKSFIASRDRYDGSDLNHLIMALKGEIDWHRLLNRFGNNWEVLLANLILFRFVYPSRRECVPKWLIDDLLDRFSQSLATTWQGDCLSRGPFFDIIGTYDVDMEQFGFIDGRQALCPPRRKPTRLAPDGQDDLDHLRCERLKMRNHLLKRHVGRANGPIPQ